MIWFYEVNERILVVGAGYANKGAEAMLLTVQAELSRRLGNAEFLIWHPKPWEVPLAAAEGISALDPPPLARGSMTGSTGTWPGELSST